MENVITIEEYILTAMDAIAKRAALEKQSPMEALTAFMAKVEEIMPEVYMNVRPQAMDLEDRIKAAQGIDPDNVVAQYQQLSKTTNQFANGLYGLEADPNQVTAAYEKLSNVGNELAANIIEVNETIFKSINNSATQEKAIDKVLAESPLLAAIAQLGAKHVGDIVQESKSNDISM